MRNLLFGCFVMLIVALVAQSARAQVIVNNYHPGSIGYSRVGYGYSGYSYSGYRGGYYGSAYGPNVYGPNVYGGGIGYTSGFAPRVYTYGGPGLYPSRFQSGFGGYGGQGYGPVPRVQYRYGY